MGEQDEKNTRHGQLTRSSSKASLQVKIFHSCRNNLTMKWSEQI